MNKRQNDDLVSINDGTQVSFKVLQDVYNSVTGKTESLTETFKEPYLIDKNDIDQLNLKMVQICDQYNVKASNCAVTVFHTKNTKEVFSSFERFNIYNTSNTAPIENLLIEYNFLILLPTLEKPQKYKISVNLPNRVGIWEKALTDSDIPAQLFRMMTEYTGRVKIDYIDYTVARTFQTHIAEWFKSLNKSQDFKFLNTLQSNSHHFRGVALFGLPTVFLAYISTLPYESFNTIPNLSDVPRLLYAAGYITVLLFAAGATLGRWVEYSIDRVQPIAYVSLNRGDIACVEKVRRKNKFGIAKAALGTLTTISVGLLTTIFSNWIGLEKLFTQ